MTKLETGYSYKYTPEKDSEDREAGLRDRDRTCCGCGESSMERYITGVGALFTLIMGPYSGAQFVAATMETDFYTTASLSLLVFIASLLMVISCHKRMVSRIWFMTGFTWVLTGYVIYLRKDFTEKPAEWLYVASIQLIVFAVTSIPILFTDPWTQALV